MTVQLLSTDIRVVNMQTRMPFRYGIVTMTALPHLLIEAVCVIDGKQVTGGAADHLPPKWFTKNPDESFRDELASLFHVIESAFAIAEQIGAQPTVFDFWQRVYVDQMQWATAAGYDPLLWNFGVSLVERVVIDAHCRAMGTTFAQAVRQNSLGIALCELHSELGDANLADMLPAEPLNRLNIRHTVGLIDQLTADDIPSEQQINDGLPQTLDACIDTYGLKYFKIKIGGEPDADIARLRRLAALLADRCGGTYHFTLDGNETYHDVGAFRQFWESLIGDASLADFMTKLLVVEQPLHREVALRGDAVEGLLAWENRPPMIIDESDGALGSCELALACGYVGTSHKNCKGIFKGIANAALIEHRRRADPEQMYVLTGEDLANVGPIALVQDLAVLATLGVHHAERNGHHYFRGLAMLPSDMADGVLQQHPDLYRRHEQGFVTLNINAGSVGLDSVINAPLGGRINFDREQFSTIDEWQFTSLGIVSDET